ncbi:hypothetical protein CC80DRAFT_487475, partial [Byssothecium circinans]
MTLQAFTQRPMPFDTTVEEYKIFACIEALTPAERDLGARVAKAAQRLKSWSEELAQWGWTGTFEQPTEQFREQRRKSLELRIKEHVKDADMSQIPALEYWGSLLSVEVEQHEARLDEISDDLLELDVEELKGHVLDMHPSGRSRPSSAGIDASNRRAYMPVDDFNFLITQTLLSALPHHFLLKERLSTWTARVTILREAPRFLDNLKTAQNAMRMGWEALGPPDDTSDTAFTNWKGTVDTISGVLRDRVGSLGSLLDRWLDTLEGRDDCLPEGWIDTFESVENDFAQWTQESHIKTIMFDVRRNTQKDRVDSGQLFKINSYSGPLASENTPSAPRERPKPRITVEAVKDEPHIFPAIPSDAPAVSPPIVEEELQVPALQPEDPEDESEFEEGDTVIHNEIEEIEDENGSSEQTYSHHDSDFPAIIATDITTEDSDKAKAMEPLTPPRSRRASIESLASELSFSSSPPGTIDESPSYNRALKAPRPALNAAMSKRRSKDPKEAAAESAPWPPTQFSHKSPHTVDDLESKISDILTTIPAHIRLTTKTGADARARRSSRGVTHKGSQGYLRAQRSYSSMKSPELTLSPAKQDPDPANLLSGRKSVSSLRGDNDIKLYHLTQPGKEHPQKLFIRRVGENGERVMVRVGGGWADLGEYLRQYAEHHGRRAVSSENFEIRGLELPNIDSSPGRSESAMSKRDRRFSGGTQVSSTHTTPVKASGIGISKDDPPPPMPDFTPTQIGSNETSAPSTGSSKTSWHGNEVGLAGPKSKKLDLSNDKLEWIEGMMKQARSVSGTNLPGNTPQSTDRPGTNSRSESRSTVRNESRTGARNESRTFSRGENRNKGAKKQPSQEFGTLGRVGGTKRIYLRGGGLGN